MSAVSGVSGGNYALQLAQAQAATQQAQPAAANDADHDGDTTDAPGKVDVKA